MRLSRLILPAVVTCGLLDVVLGRLVAMSIFPDIRGADSDKSFRGMIRSPLYGLTEGWQVNCENSLQYWHSRAPPP